MNKTKKNKLFVLVSVVASLIIILLIFRGILLRIYHDNYDVVRVKKESYLYEKKDLDYKKIGMVYKNVLLKIDKKSNNNFPYLKLKNRSYYIKYNDIVKYNKKTNKSNINNSYLKTGISIKTKDKYLLTYNDKKEYEFYKSDTYDVYLKDDSYYKVIYDGKLMNIDKKYVEKEYGTLLNETDRISILYYENVQNYYDDFLLDMEKFEKEKYTFIDSSDFILWKNKKINLPKKSVLVFADVDNKTYKINKNTDEINFNDDNSVCLIDDDVPSRYKINRKLSDEELLRIIDGKNVYFDNERKYNNQAIAVLNYHFFYDSKTEVCNELICEPVDKFREQLDYLKDNEFKVLTLTEFKDWMYGDIKLPKKSVLITIDDGAAGTSKINGNKLIPILEEYKMPGTLFLISAWWKKENYISKYLTIESHGYDIHKQGKCGKAMALCLSRENLLADLKKSLENSDSNLAFAYPFFSTNDKVSSTVKEAGFKMAFVGGYKKATRNDDLYHIPRYQILNTMDIETFKQYVN